MFNFNRLNELFSLSISFIQAGSGMGMPGSLPPDGAQAPKEKKKRKKKKKADELEGAQSQPLPPSLPNQAMLGKSMKGMGIW